MLCCPAWILPDALIPNPNPPTPNPKEGLVTWALLGSAPDLIGETALLWTATFSLFTSYNRHVCKPPSFELEALRPP